MTMSISRRGFIVHAGAALGAGVLATAGRAGAEPAQPVALPEVGQTFTMTMNGFGVTLVVNLPPPLPTLNFIGSRHMQVVEAGADQVRLRTLNFTVEAAHPLFGKITIRMDEEETGPHSILRRVAADRLQETWNQSFRIIFEKCGDCPGPYVLYTREPAEWTAELAEFPPPPQAMNPDGSPTGGALYQLTRPIRLGLPGGATSDSTRSGCGACPLDTPLPDDDATFAILEGFHVVHGRLPNG